MLTRYALVSYDNGELVVEKEELMTRSLQLHEGLGHGDVVEVLDSWCDASYPGSILASKAFTEVRVCGCSSSVCWWQVVGRVPPHPTVGSSSSLQG